MKLRFFQWTGPLWAAMLGIAHAAEPELVPVEVAPGVYLVVADTGPASYENGGFNANLGFVVGQDGVGVIDSGPSTRIARALHGAIQRVTAQPIRWVLNTNSQPNRWMGNAYFQRLGVPLYAHPAAIRAMNQSGSQQLATLQRNLRERAEGTVLALPEPLPEKKDVLSLAGKTIDARYFGPAHTAGDLVVWLPGESVAFGGDIAYTDRLLAVLPGGSSKNWLTAFDRLAALHPAVLVPGHGAIHSMDETRHQTRDYLAHVRSILGARLQAGATFEDAFRTLGGDDFRQLANFALLWRPNAYQVYSDLELEAFE